ncbi:hypothetical protein A9Z42_0041290 [Trichoderma parareesei]|uniref:Uncharacterized protein n=1 Tax=Trichoderma parareesei TaxID=858221 RepID=A0A2H2ZUD9_TRIPA|nr:hypothetical protein A9Z42_0041290 [Trichoderma parareesei]
MNPFPSTPTPRRFLLPGRSTQSSSSQTPGAPPRFQSTPRFGSSSAAKSTQRRELDIEEYEDDDDEEEEEEEEEEVVYESSLSGDQGGPLVGGSRRRVLEIESDAGVTSQEEGFPGGEDGRTRAPLRFDIEESFDTEMGREAKRRKMSISPSPLLGSPDAGDAEEATLGHLNDEADADIEDGASVMSTNSSSSSSSESSPITMRGNSKAPRQPVFQQAPRFKPLDAEDTLSGGLPAAFSPQRRGARYVSGGMASQLQGWLSEVRMWDESSDKAESVLKLHVERIRPGRRMYLVEGRVASEETSKRWILAGEGRLMGLGRRAEVKEGSVVAVGQPVWDVEVEGGVWNVACEWSVEGC